MTVLDIPLPDAHLLGMIRWPLILLGVIALGRLLLPRSSVTFVEVAREVTIVVFAYFFYSIVRGIVEGREFEPFEHASDVIALERSLGIFWEISLQEQFVRFSFLVNLANWTYMWGLWPVIIVAGPWLFLSHRKDYYLYRNAFLISGAIGLVVFGMLPVAPPRYMPAWGFVDTVGAYDGGKSLGILVNEYAAMPSLHFGWILLIGVAMVRHAQWRVMKAIGVVLPPAMFLSIVLTGNHYIIDGIAGGIVAAIGLAIAVWFQRYLDARQLGGPSPAPPALAA